MRQLSRRAAVGLELLVLPAFLVCAGKEFTAELPHSPGTLPSRENGSAEGRGFRDPLEPNG